MNGGASRSTASPFPTQSVAMRMLQACGLEPLAWAMRRMHCPVPSTDLVLEVGSGGNPYPRANILLDAYENTRERHWAPLSADRPTVLGFVENLPFRDKAFDFVIAAHVLEHSTDPAQFLSELQRVAHAGYIEVPDAFMERVNPYRDHRLEITVRDETLVIRKKAGWRLDRELVELYEDRVKPFMTRALMPKYPFAFHVRHYWQNKILFTVVNPETDASWSPPEVEAGRGTPAPHGVRGWVRDSLRGLLSQRKRNASIDILPLMRCTECTASCLMQTEDQLHCKACGTSFPVRRGIPVMNEPTRRD